MITDKNFLGRNGFMWFTGVVEDRIDPEYLGRVKVRCIGLHTSDQNDLQRPIYRGHRSYCLSHQRPFLV